MKFGRMIELHELSEKKERLEAAFVRVETGFNKIDFSLRCKTDDELFTIEINELCCFGDDLQCSILGKDNRSAMSRSSDWDSLMESNSAVVILEIGPTSEKGGESSVNQEAGSLAFNTHGVKTTLSLPQIGEGGCIHYECRHDSKFGGPLGSFVD